MPVQTEMGHNEKVRLIARICHEANRVWCEAHDDHSQEDWIHAFDWQKESAIQGIGVALSGATPEQQHQAWREAREADGWVHGPVKDPVAKTHPCLVAYSQLPEMQKAKDALFGAIVRSLAGPLRFPKPWQEDADGLLREAATNLAFAMHTLPEGRAERAEVEKALNHVRVVRDGAAGQ